MRTNNAADTNQDATAQEKLAAWTALTSEDLDLKHLTVRALLYAFRLVLDVPDSFTRDDPHSELKCKLELLRESERRGCPEGWWEDPSVVLGMPSEAPQDAAGTEIVAPAQVSRLADGSGRQSDPR